MAMRDWFNSSEFFLLGVTLAAAALYRWEKRRLKKASAKSWEMFHAACTASTGKSLAMSNLPQIEFVECRQTSGAPRAASVYAFLVDHSEVTIEVHDSAQMTRYGRLSQDKVKIAAEQLLDEEVRSLRIRTLPRDFVLDENRMDIILARLGLPPRFP
jgi:hypothetical protein